MRATLAHFFVEDNPQGAELALRELRRAGYLPDGSRVETEDMCLAILQLEKNLRTPA